MPRTKTTARSPDGSSGDAAGKETMIPESRTEEATTVPEISLMQLPLDELHPFEGHPFKVLDDELTAAFTQYSNQKLKAKEKPSVLKALQKLKDRAVGTPDRTRHKSQERDL